MEKEKLVAFSLCLEFGNMKWVMMILFVWLVFCMLALWKFLNLQLRY